MVPPRIKNCDLSRINNACLIRIRTENVVKKGKLRKQVVWLCTSSIHQLFQIIKVFYFFCFKK